MKTIITLFTFLLPVLCMGQIHLNAGVVDVQDRMDGTVLAWDIGYTQYFERIGIGANYRETSIIGDNYATVELNARYRAVDEEIYRFELGLGAGYNLDDFDFHPIGLIRNSIRLEEGVWVNLDLDNSYRNSKDWNGGGWRFETYLLIGVSLDVKWQRNLRKRKRFF